MDEKTYREFIEDVVQLDAEKHHKRRPVNKVWLVDRESGMRFGVTVVRHMGDSLEIVFSSINPEERWRIVGKQPPKAEEEVRERPHVILRSQPGHSNPTIPGDHVLDMSTFNRRNRTATCSTCGPEVTVITDLQPGIVPDQENWHCLGGREARRAYPA